MYVIAQLTFFSSNLSMQVCDVLTKEGPGKVWVDQTVLGIDLSQFNSTFMRGSKYIKLFTDFDLRIKIRTQIYYIYSCPHNEI